MIPAVSTNWNAYRHADGQSLVEEIAEAGFDTIECGWNLTVPQGRGVLDAVSARIISVCSVHAFAPLDPTDFVPGGPGAFSLCAPSAEARSAAMSHVRASLAFARKAGARNLVLHAGAVPMRHWTVRLMKLARAGKQDSTRYRRTLEKAQVARQRYAGEAFDRLRDSLEKLLPEFAEAGVCLCLENLPAWESLPSEEEMLRLCESLATPSFGYWHDFGHAALRDRLGLAPHYGWARRLQPWCRGVHIHDAVDFADEHRMPPEGTLPFEKYAFLAAKDAIAQVLEPHPGTPVEDVRRAVAYLEKTWR